jgi:hypothetical protein
MGTGLIMGTGRNSYLYSAPKTALLKQPPFEFLYG